MKVGDLTRADLAARLQRGGISLHAVPFTVRIQASEAEVVDALATLYGEFKLAADGEFIDFHVELRRSTGLRRWFRPKVDFVFDGRAAFNPLPLAHAVPMLEWGLNWCVAAHGHQFLIIHAAVMERHGRAVIMPAASGAGKSTLCAGLVLSGWRLLSDELTLVNLQTGAIHGMARPISLKNQSIGVVRSLHPEAITSKPVHDTAKGTVVLLRPPDDSVRRVVEPADPAWIVVPSYAPGSRAEFSAFSKAQSFMLLAEQSFNYDIHGRHGFEAIAGLVDRCACARFQYSNLEDAADKFEGLFDRAQEQ